MTSTPSFVGPSAVGVVLPGDNRQRVANSTQPPFRWIGQLESTWPDGDIGIGTAVLLDDVHLLTCAHNLIDRRKQTSARQAMFTPGCNRDAAGNLVTPYPAIAVSRFQAPRQYWEAGGPPPPPGGIPLREITKYLYDFAVCRLAGAVPDPPGTSGFTAPPLDPGLFPIVGGRIAGYSGDLDRTGSTMFSRTGQVNLSADEDFVSYRMSTYEGDSGAPVFYQPPGRPYWSIVAVHVTGAGDSAPGAQDGLNVGPAINEANHNLIQQMVEAVDQVNAVRW